MVVEEWGRDGEGWEVVMVVERTWMDVWRGARICGGRGVSFASMALSVSPAFSSPPFPPKDPCKAASDDAPTGGASPTVGAALVCDSCSSSPSSDGLVDAFGARSEYPGPAARCRSLLRRVS